MTSVFLLGEPATGKTTVARRVLQAIRARINDELDLFEYGRLRGGVSLSARIYCFGIYDEQLFSGTDRLSNAVIGDACDFLEQLPGGASIFLEGDRLANPRFISALQDYGPTKLLRLVTTDVVLDARRAARGNRQSARFLQSRKTKLTNLGAKFHVEQRQSDVAEDMESIATEIVAALFQPRQL